MYEKLKEMLVEQLSIDEDKITLDARFNEDLDADSLDLFELITDLEDEYGVEIPADDLEQLTTVGAFIDYLKEHGIE
ncbi:MAG: acyl carrier protein [Clostridiales bacterium]|nr:acyl carrier protein [Clostridiales bacterium]